MLAALHADPTKKEGLLKLLSSSTNLETQIIARELGAIADRVAKLEQQVIAWKWLELVGVGWSSLELAGVNNAMVEQLVGCGVKALSIWVRFRAGILNLPWPV